MHEIITFDVSGPAPESLGQKRFAQLPRVGEWIEMNVEGIGTMFEVVKVVHSAEGHPCDLYVKQLGPTPKFVRSLCGRVGAG